jgi:HK97 gp10 family phage protein
MAIRTTLKIDGLDELCRDLERAPLAASREIMHSGLGKAVEPWRDEMEARVPKGPHHFKKGSKIRGKRFRTAAETVVGYISKHIGISARANSDLDGEAQVGVKRQGFWALFLERGTRRMRARSFALPAAQSKEREVVNNFINFVRDALRRAGLKGS